MHELKVNVRPYKGEPGVSPRVRIERIEGGYRVVFTDIEGEKAYVIATSDIAPATADLLGGVKVGENLEIDREGLLRAISSIVSVNGKTGTVTLNAEDVGARPDDWTPTAAEVGARPNTWTPTAEQVGARPDTWMPTAADVGARPNTWTPAFPVTSVNSKTGAVTLNAADVGARSSTWLPPVATTSGNGLLSASDKTKLDGYASKVIDSSGAGWVRFTDGTQICWGTASRTITESDAEAFGWITNIETWATNFAKSFNATPALIVQPTSEWAVVASATANTTQIRNIRFMFGNTGIIKGKTISICYIAIGRWK